MILLVAMTWRLKMTIKNNMEEVRDIDVTLDVVLTVIAKTNAEAYEKLDDMSVLSMLKLAVEQCEFMHLQNETKH